MLCPSTMKALKFSRLISHLALLSLILPNLALASSPQAAGQSSTPPSRSPATLPSDPGASAQTAAADTVPRKYIEYWNTGDVKVMKSFFSPFYMISHGHRVVVDERMLTRVVNAWRDSMPDLNFKIEDTIVQGNKVAMRLTFTGTYKKRLFPATGDPAKFDSPRHIRATEMLMFELRDGKIWSIGEEYDELAMRTQMGGLWQTIEQLDAAHKSAAAAPKP
jgi:predicted ester cyclase